MNDIDEYLNTHFENYSDGYAYLMAKTRDSIITVDACTHKEDGEDPLIKATVSISYSRLGGEAGSVYLNMTGDKITKDDCFKAIEEFMSGPSGSF